MERHGGTIEKFIGDAVMAVWGAPTSHEDDAERAVRTALEIVGEVRGLGPEVHARVGVVTGEAAVTIGAIGEGMVAGDMVNTASRLQGMAPPDVVLVGEATMHAASGAIAFEEAGDQLLKGKSTPVPAWRALRVVAERGGRGRSGAIEAPFVGRDDELRLLKDLYHTTARDRRVRLVSVTGQGGIGKSRLAWEFLKYLDGLVETVYWHHGRSPSYGSGITFWALGEMVRVRAGLTEGDDEATTRARIGESVVRWIPDEQERRWVEASLLALLGVDEAVPGGQDRLFSAWRTYFERIAAVDPVVMVFEDLQWADSGLLAFIDHLVDWSRGVAIYVVALARPELLETRPDWGAGKRNFTSLDLEPLSAEAMRALLAGLVPGLSPDAAARIVARADGIPLYAVEIVRMLVAQGSLEAADGAYRPIGDLADVAVPETLHSLIAARLDALDPSDRALLQAAVGHRPRVHGGRPRRRRRGRRGRGGAPAPSRWRDGSSSRGTSTRAPPSAASSRSSSPSSARSPTQRSPAATGRPATSPRPATSRRSWTRSSQARSPRTTWPPIGTPPRARRPTRSRRRRGSRCGPRGIGRWRWAPRNRRSASTATRWT